MSIILISEGLYLVPVQNVWQAPPMHDWSLVFGMFPSYTGTKVGTLKYAEGTDNNFIAEELP